MEFRSDVEFEVLGILNGTVTKSDTDAATLFESLFQQQCFEERIQL